MPKTNSNPNTRVAGLPIVIGIGEVLWDLLPSGRQMGGAPANFAYHAGKLGVAAGLVSAVGKDRLGVELRARMRELGMNTANVHVDQDHPTGTVEVKLNEGGQPSYTIHENVAWDHIPFTPGLARLAGSADAICFGTLGQRSSRSRDTIGRFLRMARPGCLRVFDVNLRQNYYSTKLVAESLAVADVVKLNDEELGVVAGLLGVAGTEDEMVAGILRGRRVRLLALTRGKRGSTLYSGRRRVSHSGFKTDISDTVGAGDAFTAALTVGMLARLDLEKINQNANLLAGYVCSQPGATPDIPENLVSIVAGL